jgi:hypothetical protein
VKANPHLRVDVPAGITWQKNVSRGFKLEQRNYLMNKQAGQFIDKLGVTIPYIQKLNEKMEE